MPATLEFYSLGRVCELCQVSPAKLSHVVSTLGILPVERRNDVAYFSSEQVDRVLDHLREARESANRAENQRVIDEEASERQARDSAGWALFLLPSDLPEQFDFGGQRITDKSKFLCQFQTDIRTGSADRPTFGAGLARDLDELRVIVDFAADMRRRATN